MPVTPLTDRQKEILQTLTLRVRFLSLHQIARTWWTPTTAGMNGARRQLASLVDAGFVSKESLHAHPELQLEAPVLVWTPGNPQPHFGAVAYQLEKRWTENVETVPAYFATPKAAKHFGGVPGSQRHPYQATHDLHVSTVFLKLFVADRDTADRWCSEDRLPELKRYREKLPDAAIKDQEGKIVRLVEFGGSYNERRVEKLHRHCDDYSLPYELW